MTFRFRSFLLAAALLPATLLTTACSDDSNDPLPTAQSRSIRNLFAPQTGGMGIPVSGPFRYFNFTTGDTVPLASVTSTNWDIAFRGTTIIVNGGTATSPTRGGNAGAAVLNGTLSQYSSVPAGQTFRQDSPTENALFAASGNANAWYTYNGYTANFADGGYITPRPVVLLFRTASGNRYAKVEILSYYQTNADGTFRNPATWFAEGTHVANTNLYERRYSFNYVLTPENSTSF